MEEQELRELFKTKFSCYADTTDDSVVLAMDEDQFIKVIKDIEENIWNAALKETHKQIYMDDNILKDISIGTFKKLQDKLRTLRK